MEMAVLESLDCLASQAEASQEMCRAASMATFMSEKVKTQLNHRRLGESLQQHLWEATGSGDLPWLIGTVLHEVKEIKLAMQSQEETAQLLSSSCDELLLAASMQIQARSNQDGAEAASVLQQVGYSSYSLAMLSGDIVQLSCLEMRLEEYLRLSSDTAMQLELVGPLCCALMPVLTPLQGQLTQSHLEESLIRAVKWKHMRDSWWFWLWSCCGLFRLKLD